MLFTGIMFHLLICRELQNNGSDQIDQEYNCSLTQPLQPNFSKQQRMKNDGVCLTSGGSSLLHGMLAL